MAKSVPVYAPGPRPNEKVEVGRAILSDSGSVEITFNHTATAKKVEDMFVNDLLKGLSFQKR